MERKHRKISLFYKVLPGILLVLLLGFTYIRFGLLRPWLTRYEAAQPKHASQEVFADLFSPADWGRVYDLASGLQMNRDSFVRAMEEWTAGQELTLVETSAGLSGDRRYLVKAGSDSVASFTLTSESEGKTTTWRLDRVELLLGLTGDTVSVQTLAGQRVLVNGTELGESCRVRYTETAAERYLPQGVFGRRTVLWQAQVGSAKGVEVSVRDETGGEVPVTYDADTGLFVAAEPVEEPTDQERAMLIGAAETYARYMIRESNAAQLQKYFDSGSGIYNTIRSSEIWIQNTAGHSFADETVSDFFRYGEDIFSARVTMRMDVKRSNGSTKPYEMDSTFFFHKKDGAWRAFEMTNMDIQEEIIHARLVFMDGETELGQLFLSSEDRSFTPPGRPDHPGQRFTGWAVREQEGNSVTMTVRFREEPDGTVTLPAGYRPEPMVLYAVFETE